MKPLIFFIGLFHICYMAYAQPSVNYISANTAANMLAGPGVVVSNAVFTGNPIQLGSFSNGSSEIGIGSGIVLSSNDAAFVQGQNSSDPGQTSPQSFCDDTNGPHDADLAQLASFPLSYSKCPAILEFDFTTTGTEAYFEYIFASEEWYAFSPTVGNGCNPSTFNDAFGFFVSGPGISGTFSNNAVNIALTPGGQAVSVNTINQCNNSSLLVNNCFGNGCGASGYPSGNSGHLPFPFNARTVLMEARRTVSCIPGTTYHIKLAVCNMADSKLDAAVFLKEDSFKSDFILSSIVASPVVICEGQPTTLTVQGDNGWTYEWSDGQSGVGLKTINVIPPVGTTTYTVTATNTDGCQLTQSVNVVVHPNNNIPPYLNGINNTGEYTYFANDGDYISFTIPSFDNPTEEVELTLLNQSFSGFNFSLAGLQQTGTFTWQPDVGSYGIFTFDVLVCDRNACVPLCETFSFTIIITCPQCPLDVYYENRSAATTPLPSLTKAPRKIVAGYSVDPSQTDGDVIVDVGENVTFEAGVLVDLQPGFYHNGGIFIAQIVPNTCIDECNNCCQDWTQFTYDYIPNIFTPNGDGDNDVWNIPDSQNPTCAYNANGFELLIYNRWGCLVYSKIEDNDYCCPFETRYISWDGNANSNCFCSSAEQSDGCIDAVPGQPVSVGTYFYIVKFQSGIGSCYHEEVATGNITLLTQPQMPEHIFEFQGGNEPVQPDGTTLSFNSSKFTKEEYGTFISIYPNPVSDQFTVAISDHFVSESTVIEIFDSQGRLLLSESLESTQKIINFNSFSTGLYMVRVSGNGYSVIKSLVKN
jgi:gliding motility-associated-like protein